MQVTVPAGMGPGMAMQVQTTKGMMQVTVPYGLAPGGTFEVEVPM